MYQEEALLERAVIGLEKRYGRALLRSPVFDFTFTDYYTEEMGLGLKKVFVGFEKTISPDELAQVKLFANSLEEKYAFIDKEAKKRTLNIDPGYVGEGKVVLASTKNRSQRIYLGRGVFAEVTLLFKGGVYLPLPWTYPDYKTPLACSFFQSFKNL